MLTIDARVFERLTLDLIQYYTLISTAQPCERGGGDEVTKGMKSKK